MGNTYIGDEHSKICTTKEAAELISTLKIRTNASLRRIILEFIGSSGWSRVRTYCDEPEPQPSFSCGFFGFLETAPELTKVAMKGFTSWVF
jgi:hypothetical protein